MTAAAALSVAGSLPEATAAAIAASLPGGRPHPCSTWRVSRPGRPRSLNAERSASHWTHRRVTEAERAEWSLLWGLARLPRPIGYPVFVVARPLMCGNLQDPGNCYPSVKSAVDGLVDHGAIQDDDGTWVKGILMLPPVRVSKKLHDELVVVVVPLRHEQEGM